ncbi:hypothetical protein H2201_007626 [Coniosporium apollinis]|uniref:Steroid 5-alpha reductase C-terminal domain-containing protein n=2 Tax=Coniosporium TaxID=2810619 RepID=A0ABQ9NKH3_9PEZI|nr:hypothetical protein H2199_006331 [Cladosporium sp. JES 115]KAJ9658845.1 hypothetical protein H2201_007626 [Coniosporium apollinis]
MSSSEAAGDNRGKKKMDMIKRGSYNPTPLGKAVFVGLRALDPILQYGILARGLGSGLLQKLGLDVLPQGLPTHTGTPIDALGLSPYRLILLSMAVGSMLKQNYWLLAISAEEMPPSSAVLIAIFNTVANSLNTLGFICAATSASLNSGSTFPQVPLLVGSIMYAIGIAVELISEIQRSNFKKDPKNKGKAYTGGLWSWARHINYGGYSLWRGGFALAAAGWTWGAIVLGFFLYDFTNRAIPVLDDYCSKRYGDAWTEFKKKTPYQILPFIY